MAERQEHFNSEEGEPEKVEEQRQQGQQQKGKQSISTVKEQNEEEASEKITQNDFHDYENSEDEKEKEEPKEENNGQQTANFSKKEKIDGKINAQFQNQNDEPQVQAKVEAEKKEEVSPQENDKNDKPQKRIPVEQAVAPALVPSQRLIKEAQTQRMGSIFKTFNEYYSRCHQTLSNYKLILSNVCISIATKVQFKKQLQQMLLEYFQDYAKVHRHFHDKTIKISKEEESTSVNKFVNIKEDLRKGFEELVYLRRNLGVNAEKLDGYIANHINKSIKLAFTVYRQDIHSFDRGEFLTIKDEFQTQQKTYKKLISTLQKICKKGMDGEKYKQDIFVELVAYVQQQKVIRQTLKKYGKMMINLRKNYVSAEKKLFSTLQTIMNQFKNQQKTVYAAQPQFNKIIDYTQFIEKKTKFEDLCTITDVDFIKSVLELQNRKERIQFKDEHFQEFLQMEFFEKLVGVSSQILKNASTKSFPMKKPNRILMHSLSENLVQFDKEKQECHEKYEIKNLDARIFAEAAVQFEIVSGFIFKDKKLVRIELRDSDIAHELIGYLNTMQEIKGPVKQ